MTSDRVIRFVTALAVLADLKPLSRAHPGQCLRQRLRALTQPYLSVPWSPFDCWREPRVRAEDAVVASPRRAPEAS